jgi:hypothetical protein
MLGAGRTESNSDAVNLPLLLSKKMKLVRVMGTGLFHVESPMPWGRLQIFVAAVSKYNIIAF